MPNYVLQEPTECNGDGYSKRRKSTQPTSFKSVAGCVLQTQVAVRAGAVSVNQSGMAPQTHPHINVTSYLHPHHTRFSPLLARHSIPGFEESVLGALPQRDLPHSR